MKLNRPRTESFSIDTNKCIETLNQVSDQFLDVKEEQDIYLIMGDAVRRILPEAFFIVSKLQPDDMNFRIIESSGFDKYFNAIKTLVGQDPYAIDFPFKDLTDEQLKAFESRKLYLFPGGIHDLANNKISKIICRGIEKMLGIESVYAMSFFVGKKYFGGIALFIPHSVIRKNIFNAEVILTLESISKQASVLIQNLRDKDALRLKEEELTTSHEKFAQLVNQLNDMIWMANVDGTDIVDLNGSFEKIYGYPSSEFKKNPNLWIEVVHPDDRMIARQSGEQLFKTGNASTEYRIVRPDGKTIWLKDHKSVVFDKNGKPVQMGGRATDITDRKLLEEELKIMNYALDDSPTAIGLADLSGSIFYVNDAYIKLFEFNNKEEVLGRKISVVSTFEEQVEDILANIRKGKTHNGEIRSIRNDGSFCYFIISARAIISEGKPICLMALFIDITERKKAELKLSELSRQLKETNDTKDKFFSIIAHDLKAPFNSILGFADLLSNNYFEFTDKQRLEYIDSLYISTQNQYRLLENLLDWARLQRGQIEIKKELLNLKSLVDECLEYYRLIAIEKNIELRNTVPESIIINADNHSLETILRNLINNALKFTFDGGSVCISSSYSEEMIEISVKDTGIGMDQNKIDKLFRIEESTSTSGTNGEKGTGLGLILCRELIHKNHGEIGVESESGKGTIFKISIPK